MINLNFELLQFQGLDDMYLFLYICLCITSILSDVVNTQFCIEESLIVIMALHETVIYYCLYLMYLVSYSVRIIRRKLGHVKVLKR